MAKTHLTTGFTSGALAAGGLAAAGVPDIICLTVVPVVAYSALVPDIDHPNSFITYSLGPVTIILSWLLRGCPVGWWIDMGFWIWRRPVGFGFHLAPWRCPHRGPTHRAESAPWIFGLLVAAAVWYLPLFGDWFYVIGAAASLGVLTHIWGDSRTVSGVPFGGDNHHTIGRPFVTGSTPADADEAYRHGEISLADWTWFRRHNEATLYRYVYRPATWLALAFGAFMVIQP